MQIPIRASTATDGTHGEDSSKEALHINLGYGLLEIMKLNFSHTL